MLLRHRRMVRPLLAAMVLASTSLMLPALASGAPLALKSVNVNLPDSDRMFSGPGADAANSNCLACHSAGMVLTQPTLSKAQWEAEVNKMIDAYKAPIAKDDVGLIVDYLVKIRAAN
jgi:cytochrome c553